MPEMKEALKMLREEKIRNFSQSLDLVFVLKNVDMKKPENRFAKNFPLPKGRGKELKVGVYADSMSPAARKAGLDVISKEEIKGKKAARKIAKKYDFTMAEAPLMAIIGKEFGQVLSPRGKMPVPVGPTTDLKAMADNLKRNTKIALRGTPVIQVAVGSEDMADEDIIENMKAVIDDVKAKLPKGLRNIKKVYAKFTMSKPVEIEVR